MSIVLFAGAALALTLAAPPPLPPAPNAAPEDVVAAAAWGRVGTRARTTLPGGESLVVVAFQAAARPGPSLYVAVLAQGATGWVTIGRDDIEGVLPAQGEVSLALSTTALPAAPGVFSVDAEVKRPDGSVDAITAIYRYTASVTRLLVLPAVHRPPPGGRTPGTTRELSLLPSSSGGVRDLRVTRRTRTCAAPDDCAEDVEVGSYSLEGGRYAARPFAVPAVVKIVASSTLASRAGLANYAADSAVDGRPDTSWCEGAKGPGWFEKLELTLAPAQKLSAITVIPGRGTGEEFLEATRPKRLRVILPDGRKAEADLADAPTRQRIALPPGDRVFGLTVQIVDVYKGKKEEACIAELDLEVEP
jgi:hypothetical protein